MDILNKVYNKQFKWDFLQFAGFTSFNILANYKKPLNWALYTLREIGILGRAIRSQMNLKPYFYKKSSKVGTYGSVVGFFITYLVFFKYLDVVGIDINEPLRNSDFVSNLKLLAFAIFLLIFFLYTSCSFFAALYFRRSYLKKHISRYEYLNIVFKSTYPDHWQKGRQTGV